MDQDVIFRLGSNPGVAFAATELRRYLARASPRRFRVRKAGQYEPGKPGIWVGLFSDFAGHVPPPASSDPLDDEILIRTDRGSGIIAGSNARSVLLAVYRFLTELGFRWVRPGRGGEVVPHLKRRPGTVRLHETPSYRHRAVCIEGAVSFEHVRDMIDWLPKVGMNAYFIQFREAYNFFQRWYEHEGNPRLPKETFTLERARDLTRRVCQEITKRGMILQMVGHGWTCEPFGIPGTGWYKHKGEIPTEAVQYLAEVNGKRALWGDIALNTNLCYGNPRAREIIVNAIVDYARNHPEVDVIHFWLADGSNNHCECPLCRDHRPADLYVRMLNDLDVKLTQANVPTRIVFLIYVDLLWPPEKERIANPGRFILMFAPITRSYSTSFAARRGDAALPPFERNKLKFPSDPKVNIAFLRAWQAIFPGDSFDFDYHYMWDHYKDPGYVAMAEVLHQDIRSLRDIGLGGFNSCQVQRAFFPTGLGMTVMARTLWNRRLRFGELADDHFRAAFGPRGKSVANYLRALSDRFHPKTLRRELTPEERRDAARNQETIPDLVAKFMPVIEKGLKLPNATQARSWRYLQHHAAMCLRLSDAMVKSARGDEDGAKASARALVDWARRHERSLHPVLDVALFLRVVPPLLGLSPKDF